MGIFSRKPAYCTICNKQVIHKNKAKREWDVKSPLCSDCYLNKMQESYDASIIKKCINCGVKSKVTDLWEPRLQWDIVGLLCKKCFDEKELDFNKEKISVVFVVLNLVLLDIIQKTIGKSRDNCVKTVGMLRKHR